MEQILEQPERAQPSTDKTPAERADEHQEPRRIKSKFKIPAPNDRLQRADRTGSKRPRARITVQPGNAQIFQFSLVDFPLHKAQEIAICQKCPQRLRPMPFPLIILFFLIQFRYTPYRYSQLFPSLRPSPPGRCQIPSSPAPKPQGTFQPIRARPSAYYSAFLSCPAAHFAALLTFPAAHRAAPLISFSA